MVHGAGNALWGPASIKARWLPALEDGLAWHGVSIHPSEVEVAFYGDLFRKDPERGYEPDLDAREMLANVGELLHQHDQDVDLDELVNFLAEQHLDRLLAQAGAYLQQPELRRAARARLVAAIGPDTEVVVAHSLGTVVAYETLAEHDEWDLAGLVTLGSPLGGDLIMNLLDPPPTDGVGQFPAGVRRWVNIRNAADPACVRPLADAYAGDVSERLVDNGHRVHDPEPYLNNPTTGAAIASML